MDFLFLLLNWGVEGEDCSWFRIQGPFPRLSVLFLFQSPPWLLWQELRVIHDEWWCRLATLRKEKLQSLKLPAPSSQRLTRGERWGNIICQQLWKKRVDITLLTQDHTQYDSIKGLFIPLFITSFPSKSVKWTEGRKRVYCLARQIQRILHREFCQFSKSVRLWLTHNSSESGQKERYRCLKHVAKDRQAVEKVLKEWFFIQTLLFVRPSSLLKMNLQVLQPVVPSFLDICHWYSDHDKSILEMRDPLMVFGWTYPISLKISSLSSRSGWFLKVFGDEKNDLL